MCGIWACIGSCTESEAKDSTAKVLPRGPEGLKILSLPGITLGFTRLAINGLTESGMQPMSHNNIHWVCNGEIYNWHQLATKHNIKVHEGTSDCAILGDLWVALEKNPEMFFRALDGVFSIILVDLNTNEIIIGRDPYGVRPLFTGRNLKTDQLYFASEMKALLNAEDSISSFQPGHYAVYGYAGESVIRLAYKRYHTIPWLKNPLFSPGYEGGLELATTALRKSLEIAVCKRLMTERPCAALLSGGVDSSLICALVQKELKALGKPPLKTFSIGFPNSPDLFYARKVAEHIGSEHTEIVSSPDEFFNAIPEVIKSIESYDITSVRASVGNWLICREIAKRTDCKVVFNGDGSDEVFGSYLYFFRAPTDEAFEAESSRLLEDIHLYDVLRSDRSISSHGLEARTPFLDKQFVAIARSIATEWRRPRKPVIGMERSVGDIDEGLVEKWILRKAFSGTNILPDAVLWRQKEAFSDGVSPMTNTKLVADLSASNGVSPMTNTKLVTDLSGTNLEKPWYKEIADRVPKYQENKYTHLIPQTPEAQYYRDIFTDLYGDKCARIFKYFWMPKWSGETKDPSARTLSIYTS